MRNIEEYTKTYIKSDFESYQVYYRRKKILEVLEKHHPKRILEIGCGMEPLFEYMDMNSVESYYVVEPSKEFYDNAVIKSKGLEQITCFNDFVENCTEKFKGKIDFIICSSLLHEVETPKFLLEKICDLCTDTTIVHINVPNALSLHRLIAMETEIIKDSHELSPRNKQLQQHNVYDMNILENQVREVGFKVIEKGSYFVKPFTHNQMFAMLQEDIISEKVLNGLYNLVNYIPEYGSEIYVNVILNLI